MISGAVRIKSFIYIYFARTVRFRFRFKICIEGYTEFSAQTALKQKLVNPQWTQPIPITIGYYRVYSRQKKRNAADKRLKKGGGGRLQAVGVGGFFEIGDWLDGWWSMIGHWSGNCRAGFSYDCWRQLSRQKYDFCAHELFNSSIFRWPWEAAETVYCVVLYCR